MGNSCCRSDQDKLVGPPIAVEPGKHGQELIVKPGEPADFYVANICFLIPQWLLIFLLWPISLTVFLVIFVGQFCSPCCFPCLGNEWCYLPTQISYIHALYVMQHSVRKKCVGWLCCGCFVQLQPAIMLVTVFLHTPPRFLFDEDGDTAVLLSFDEYVEKKRDTFPPYSGRYRAIDGGGNHERYTFIGQGGRGYAMNEPFMILEPRVLPDPEEMQRALQMRAKFAPSAWAQNSLATFFANVAIHEFFRSATGASNKYTGGVNKPWVNLHSGYLDLQVVYGFNKEISDSVRTFQGGKLKGIAEERFNARVPESEVIVKLLMREHNWVCDQLAQRYPSEFNTDELLFQQARLIMGAVFINIVLRQYGDQMFGENAPNGEGFVELRQNFGCWPNCGPAQDVGNHNTLAFNLCYRWHTGIPAEWNAETASRTKIETDDQMRQVVTNMVQWAAGGFGPNNMPSDLFQRNISVPAAAVRDGRICGAPRLNDFRRRFQNPYKDFMDMCGDEELARRLQQFYPSVEDVEMAVGVQVERCAPGGWNLPDTVNMAIVADAFNSIRQDRFYTTDFTPEIYTPWGHEHAKTTILADLLNRHLDMGIDRDAMISRLPGYKGPPLWSEIEGFPNNTTNIDARGYVPLKDPAATTEVDMQRRPLMAAGAASS